MPRPYNTYKAVEPSKCTRCSRLTQPRDLRPFDKLDRKLQRKRICIPCIFELADLAQRDSRDLLVAQREQAI